MDLRNIRNFKFNAKSFDFKKIKDSFLDFLLNRFGVIFMSIFLVAAAIAGFIVYKYMYNYSWSDNQKTKYRIQIENSKTPFDLNKFNDIIERINKRKDLNSGNVIISKDIFGTTE